MKRFGVLAIAAAAALQLTAAPASAASMPSVTSALFSGLVSNGKLNHLKPVITATAVSISVSSALGGKTTIQFLKNVDYSNPNSTVAKILLPTKVVNVSLNDLLGGAISADARAKLADLLGPKMNPWSRPIPEAKTTALYALGFSLVAWAVLRSRKAQQPASTRVG